MVNHVQIGPEFLPHFHHDDIEVCLSSHYWQFKVCSILSYQLVGKHLWYSFLFEDETM